MSTRTFHCLWRVSAAVLLATWLPSGLWAQVDAVFANYPLFGGQDSPNRICLGDGDGGFSCSDVTEDNDPTSAVALGFVNADKHLDAIFANWFGIRVCLGDGGGGFSCSDGVAGGGSGVALGFVDADWHLDALFSRDGGENEVCLGDGSGGFSCSNVSSDTHRSSGVALGFVNGDRYLDAVFTNFHFEFRNSFHQTAGSVAPGEFLLQGQLPSRQVGQEPGMVICLGDGSGGFSCSDGPPGRYSRLALGLVNSDAHLDAIVTNRLSSIDNQICLGDGRGGFSCSDISNTNEDTWGVALGFVNADGSLDAIFANDGAENQVCLGDGSGGFSCSNVSTDDDISVGVALDFVNADGHLDAIFANVGENQICLGDGLGGFSCSNVASDTYSSYDVALGDLNPPFSDGFESGDTSAWSDSVP